MSVTYGFGRGRSEQVDYLCWRRLSKNRSTKRLVGILVPGGRGNTFIPMSCPPHSVYPPKRSRSTTSPNSVAIFALQHPLLPPPWAVPAGDSSFCRQIEHPMSLPNRASERLPGAPRRTRWCCQRTEMIERSYQNAQYTCFSSSSMHFWRTDTVVRTMLEHDRCAFSIVVQTTTKSPGYCTRQTIANSASPRCA